MLKKIFFISVVIFLFVHIYPTSVKAAGEFSTTYNVSYDVDETGSTLVTEEVSLKNLTDNYYASSFSLLIGATKISDIVASDNGGPLETSTAMEGTKTRIAVKFNSQIAGKDKTLNFTLRFRSSDFAQQQGKIWQVSVPKISSTSGVDQYQLTLSVPVSFGDPTSILPTPTSQSESGGKINLNFSKDQLTEAGILANFGQNQLFDFKLDYHLENSSILPTVAKIALPADGDYQQVSINSISPKPDNVSLDSDGNYIGFFKLSRHQSLDVSVTGVAKLYINSLSKLKLLSAEQSQELISPQKYWEADNPLIKAKLADIFKDSTPTSNKDKAQLINNFVVNTLKYDNSRLQRGDFSRLGGLTALNNPDSALCQEFSDLFVTLARAEGIPARELDGYAYTSNKDLRPLSFGGSILHAWPEYFDPDLGWVMIDPTWQNTTGGVNYFSKFDLNHLVLSTLGQSSTEPSSADTVSVNFSSAEFNPHPNLSFSLDSPGVIYAGFPSKLSVKIENNGSSILPSSNLSFNSSQISVAGESNFNTPPIPPQGNLNYSFDLRSQGLFDNFNDSIELDIAGQKIQKQVSVRPFYQFEFFPEVIFGLLAIMIALYSGVLGLHIYKVKKSK